jgi:hypothetical protein
MIYIRKNKANDNLPFFYEGKNCLCLLFSARADSFNSTKSTFPHVRIPSIRQKARFRTCGFLYLDEKCVSARADSFNSTKSTFPHVRKH